MSQAHHESARGSAKEPTIEYSDSTRSTADGSQAYGDSKVYGSNPNPHNDTSRFGRDTHVNQDSVVKDRADGKDRLGNSSDMTGSSAEGNLSGTTEQLTHGGNQEYSAVPVSTNASHVHDANCGHDSGLSSHNTTSHNTTHSSIPVASHDSDHVHDSSCGHNSIDLSHASSTGGGLLGNLKSHKVDGASSLDTTKSTHQSTFDGPVSSSHTPSQSEANRSGAFGSSDVGGSGVGSGVRSDYDALGNRVGSGHREGHTFQDEDHGEKVGMVDKIKSKLGMNSGDERRGDFSNVDEHGSSHAAGQGGANRI